MLQTSTLKTQLCVPVCWMSLALVCICVWLWIQMAVEAYHPVPQLPVKQYGCHVRVIVSAHGQANHATKMLQQLCQQGVMLGLHGLLTLKHTASSHRRQALESANVSESPATAGAVAVSRLCAIRAQTSSYRNLTCCKAEAALAEVSASLAIGLVSSAWTGCGWLLAPEGCFLNQRQTRSRACLYVLNSFANGTFGIKDRITMRAWLSIVHSFYMATLQCGDK